MLKSTDGGGTWALSKIYEGAAGKDAANVWPVMAIDRGIAYARQNSGPRAKANPSFVTCLPGPPVPNLVVSRKTHGAATFDIPLPLPPASPGIECRAGQPAADSHKVVITFAAPVTFSSATVCAGAGTVANTSTSGSEVTVNLTGVTNAQRIDICLLNAADNQGNSGTGHDPHECAPGRTTANGAVNSSDISQTKSQSGQTVSGSNFRQDVNGAVNSSDISLVKSKSGTGSP